MKTCIFITLFAVIVLFADSLDKPDFSELETNRDTFDIKERTDVLTEDLFPDSFNIYRHYDYPIYFAGGWYVDGYLVSDNLNDIFIYLGVKEITSDSCKLKGKVTDKKSRDQLGGVSIKVLDPESDTIICGARTDNNGKYYVMNLEPGIYNLNVTYGGYESLFLDSVEIFDDRTTVVDIEMEPLNLKIIPYEKNPFDNISNFNNYNPTDFQIENTREELERISP